MAETKAPTEGPEHYTPAPPSRKSWKARRADEAAEGVRCTYDRRGERGRRQIRIRPVSTARVEPSDDRAEAESKRRLSCGNVGTSAQTDAPAERLERPGKNGRGRSQARSSARVERSEDVNDAVGSAA